MELSIRIISLAACPRGTRSLKPHRNRDEVQTEIADGDIDGVQDRECSHDEVLL